MSLLHIKGKTLRVGFEIQGESGVGREKVARKQGRETPRLKKAIHEREGRNLPERFAPARPSLVLVSVFRHVVPDRPQDAPPRTKKLSLDPLPMAGKAPWPAPTTGR